LQAEHVTEEKTNTFIELQTLIELIIYLKKSINETKSALIPFLSTPYFDTNFKITILKFLFVIKKGGGYCC